MHRQAGVFSTRIPAGNNPVSFQATKLGRTSRTILIGSFDELEGGKFGSVRLASFSLLSSKPCLSPTPITKNGWPSVTYPGVEPNTPNAVASIAQESVGAVSVCLPNRSLGWPEILRFVGLQMFILQNCPGRRCRLVRPSILGLPGARLRNHGYESEAQIRLRSQDFVLKGSIIVIKYTYRGYNASTEPVYDFPPRCGSHVLFGLLGVYLNLEHAQRRSGDKRGVVTKRREPCDFIVDIFCSLIGLPPHIFCRLFRCLGSLVHLLLRRSLSILSCVGRLALGGTEGLFGGIYRLLASVNGVGEALSDGLVNL